MLSICSIINLLLLDWKLFNVEPKSVFFWLEIEISISIFTPLPHFIAGVKRDARSHYVWKYSVIHIFIVRIEFITYTSAYLQPRRRLGLHKFLTHSYLIRKLSHICYYKNFCLSLYFLTFLVKPSDFASLSTLFHFISFRFIRFFLLVIYF